MKDSLKTDRLVLRSLSLDDAPAFSLYMNDYDLAKMTGSIPHPFPILAAEFKIMAMQAQKRRGLAVPYAITQNGGKLIGIADIFRRSPTAPWELGYWLAKPYWGQGYCREAMQGLVTEIQNSQNISYFIANVWHDNPASVRLLETLGFQPTGPQGRHFCMARLEKVQSYGFTLDLSVAQAHQA